VAKSYISKLAGLLGRKQIEADYALVIPECNMIHTFFMAVSIDVVMIDRAGRAACLRENMRPWGFMGCLKADKTVEMKAGSIKASGIKQGDIIRFES
jgi:uncharacterized membrane protein (UPF0127 family)